MAESTSSEEIEQASLFQRALANALTPVQLAISPTAIKAYLSTLLFLTTSFILLSLSTTAYLFFYYNFIPQINLSHTVYLQYGSGPYPHASTPLDSSALVSQQPYDVSVHLHLPKTPTNLRAGNFMLDLSLLAAPNDIISSTITNVLPNGSTPFPYTTLFSSRRPAILPYTSPMLGLASTFMSLPWHLLSFRDLDSTHLAVPMFERISFARGSAARTVPRVVRLELQSEHTLQVYSASVEFQARFEGLRYVIYNYRVLSFLVFSAIFYAVAIGSMAVAWLTISTVLFPRQKSESEPGIGEGKRIKREPGEDGANLSNGTIKQEASASGGKRRGSSSSSDQGLSLSNLSDTATTFPGIGRQMPLRMPLRKGRESASSSSAAGAGASSSTAVEYLDPTIPTAAEEKEASTEGITPYLRGAGLGDEDAEDVMEQTSIEPLPTAGEVGDDEDEPEPKDADSRGRNQGSRDFDSGIGTSMESENTAASGVTRRRNSRQS